MDHGVQYSSATTGFVSKFYHFNSDITARLHILSICQLHILLNRTAQISFELHFCVELHTKKAPGHSPIGKLELAHFNSDRTLAERQSIIVVDRQSLPRYNDKPAQYICRAFGYETNLTLSTM